MKHTTSGRSFTGCAVRSPVSYWHVRRRSFSLGSPPSSAFGRWYASADPGRFVLEAVPPYHFSIPNFSAPAHRAVFTRTVGGFFVSSVDLPLLLTVRISRSTAGFFLILWEWRKSLFNAPRRPIHCLRNIAAQICSEPSNTSRSTPYFKRSVATDMICYISQGVCDD